MISNNKDICHHLNPEKVTKLFNLLAPSFSLLSCLMLLSGIQDPLTPKYSLLYYNDVHLSICLTNV